MKQNSNSATQLLDLPYAPEAEAYLDELERSGQFRIGVDAEIDEALEANATAASNDYTLARGMGNLLVQDWWTSGRVTVRIAADIPREDLVMARLNESLVLRTRDEANRLTLDGYLDLIPDASTLRVVFADGTEWADGELLSRIDSWLIETPAAPPNH